LGEDCVAIIALLELNDDEKCETLPPKIVLGL
jgi:hypothetical protein